MRKLAIHSVLFVLPILLLLALIPVDRRVKFKELKDDCLSKGIWIHDRIHINTTPIDIAFLGSSHTINAINEQVIETHLIDTNSNVVNLGYCRLGRNLNFALLKQIGLKKTPHTIVLEIRENENLQGHPIAPYVNETKDYFKWNSWIQTNCMKDIWNHFSYTTQLTQDKYFNKIDSLHVFPWNHYHKSADDTAVSFNYDYRPLTKKPKFMFIYPQSYIKQIADWCSKNNVKLVFMYLPNYAYRNELPLHLEFYRKYGEVWLPPSDILDDKNLWFDLEHLNTAGAEKYSKWVADKLNQ